MPLLLLHPWRLASSSPFHLATYGFQSPPRQQKSGRDGAIREGDGRQENGAIREGNRRQENGVLGESEEVRKSAQPGKNGWTSVGNLSWKQDESIPDFSFNMFSNYPPIPQSSNRRFCSRSVMERRGETGSEVGSLFYQDAKMASRRHSRSVGSRSSPSRSSIPGKFSKYSKEVSGKTKKGNGIGGKSGTGLVSLPWLPSDKADTGLSEIEGGTWEGRVSSSDRKDDSHSEVDSFSLPSHASSEVSQASSDYTRTCSPALTLSYQPEQIANYDDNDEGADFIGNEDDEAANYEKTAKDEDSLSSDSNSPATRRVARAENCQLSSSSTHSLSDLPFEFRYSYSETPKVAPLRYREPQFSPFGPTTMGRPWTGRAPLKPSKKKVPEFDSFNPPPSGKKGVKYVQSPGPFIEGQAPREAKSREEILGEPLSKEEVAALVNSCMREQRQVNLGRDGLTHNMLDLVHTHWKRRRVCRIKCKGVPTVDMDNVCFHLEDKIGGKIIHRVGGVVYLFRGRYYNYRYRPKIPLMLWKPAAPVYPKLIQPAPGGLTKEEVNELVRIGRKVVPICKLGKNGVYLNLVKDVRGAFKVDELVRINCEGLNPSDYKKIGAKLQDLVPCVLLSFEREHILMWRGRRSNCSPVTDDHTERADAAQNTTVGLELGTVHVQHTANELMLQREDSFDTSTLSKRSGDLSSEMADAISSDSLTSFNAASSASLPNSAANKNISVDSIYTTSKLCENAELATCSDVPPATTNSFDEGSPPDSAAFSDSVSSVQEDIASDNLISDAFDVLLGQPFSSGSVCASDNMKYVEGLGIQLEEKYATKDGNLDEERGDSDGVDCLWKQAIETGMALVLDDMNLDSDLVFAKAAHFSKTAPEGPPYTHRLLHTFGPTESKREHLSEISIESKNIGRRKRRTAKNKEMQIVNPPLLEDPGMGALPIDELARLLAP